MIILFYNTVKGLKEDDSFNGNKIEKKRKEKTDWKKMLTFALITYNLFFFFCVLIVQTIIVPNLPVHHGSTGIPAVTFDDKISEKV